MPPCGKSAREGANGVDEEEGTLTPDIAHVIIIAPHALSIFQNRLRGFQFLRLRFFPLVLHHFFQRGGLQHHQ
jgi:hypothetical protein